MILNKDFVSENYYVGGNDVKYIVIHYTGNKGDTARNNRNYFKVYRGASAHVFVDDKECLQIIDFKNRAWHCGDGHGKYDISNNNSIGIEMCGDKNGNISSKTRKNTLELVKYLQKKYSVPNSKVVRHYDASRKNCPSCWSKNDWTEWKKFKKELEGTKVDKVESNISSNNSSNYKLKNQTGVCTVVVNNLRIREKPTTKSNTVGSYGKGSKVNYDKIVDNDGYRWISWIGQSSGKRRFMAVRVLKTNERYGHCV